MGVLTTLKIDNSNGPTTWVPHSIDAEWIPFCCSELCSPFMHSYRRMDTRTLSELLTVERTAYHTPLCLRGGVRYMYMHMVMCVLLLLST